ncbi:unnamed protein product [Soboliphyme baturini]|uniref:SERTA domain-containing protein n=1 Tax=Soboliphyme baturini TaxID=241478 RepID=A0A183ICW8_9BILA|nr:unnamed protein product [Soboliphyme baturini]
MWNRSFSLVDSGSEIYETMDMSETYMYSDFSSDYTMPPPPPPKVPQPEVKKQEIVHLCLYKLQTLAQQQRDTSLRKSVLISNTLRLLQNEMLSRRYNQLPAPTSQGDLDAMEWSLHMADNNDSSYCTGLGSVDSVAEEEIADEDDEELDKKIWSMFPEGDQTNVEIVPDAWFENTPSLPSGKCNEAKVIQ